MYNTYAIHYQWLRDYLVPVTAIQGGKMWTKHETAMFVVSEQLEPKT